MSARAHAIVPAAADQEVVRAGRSGSGVIYDKVSREVRTFWRFFRLVFPYFDKVVLMMLLIIVGVPLGEIGLFLWRYTVDEIIMVADKPMALRLQQFGMVLCYQLCMWFVFHGFGIIRQIMGFYLDLKVTLDLKKKFYNHLHTLSLGFLGTRPVGEHMFRMEADTSGQGRAGLIYMITDDVPQAFQIIYSLCWQAVLLTVVDWRLTVALILYIIPYSLGAHYMYTLLKGTMRQHKIQAQRVIATLRDGIAGYKVVKGYGRIQHQVLKYTRQILEERRAWWKYTWLSVLTHQGILWIFRFLMHNALYIYVVISCMTGRLSLGEYMITMALIRRFERPLERFIQLVQSVRLQLVSAERVLETLDVEPEIVDAPDAVTMPPMDGKVEFRNVSFEYVPGEPVLRDFSVTVRPGESVAFVGPSGAGKSTVMYLLLRLYEPQSGEVLLDGVDLKRAKMQSYLDQMGVVLQETFLFGGSFADNIRYGKLTASPEEIRHAAEMADIHDFIVSLPDGYDRDLGEGMKLSGGQRQRLGIARAMVRDPRILVLDEATASLDSLVENHVMRTVRRAMKGRTTLMISHRLVTVTDCDRIVVIDKGRVVETGTHEQLLRINGLYRLMWDEQTRGGVAS